MQALSAIAGQLCVVQGDLTNQLPPIRAAGEGACIGRQSGQGTACQLRQGRRRDIHGQAFRTAQVLNVDLSVHARRDVVGEQTPGHGLHTVFIRQRYSGEAKACGATDPVNEGRKQVRAAEVHIPRGARTLVAEPALNAQGYKVTRPRGCIDHPAIGHGVHEEGLVGRIAEHPGQRATPGLAGFKGQLHLLDRLSQRGLKLQEVAFAIEAEGVDRRRGQALAKDLGFALQPPMTVGLTEILVQFDLGREMVDVDIQRHGARGVGRDLKDRTTQHVDAPGGDLIRMEAAPQQRQIAPVDPKVGDLKPDTLLVGDRDPRQGEVVEEIAFKALDIDPTVATDLFAVGKGAHQLAARPAEQIGPAAQKGHPQQNHDNADRNAGDDCDPSGQGPLLPGGLRRIRLGTRRGGVGQNAWPILM